MIDKVLLKERAGRLRKEAYRGIDGLWRVNLLCEIIKTKMRMGGVKENHKEVNVGHQCENEGFARLQGFGSGLVGH